MRTTAIYSYRTFWLLSCILLTGAGRLAAQEDIITSFRNNASAVLQEKLYLHTDKSFYAAGEICWFKIYDVDAGTQQPLAFSSLAYTEILDNNNKPILRAKIALTGSEGSGSFLFPPVLFPAPINFARIQTG